MPDYARTHRVAETDDPTTLDLDTIRPNTDVVLPDGRVRLEGQFFSGWGDVRFRAEDGADPVLTVPNGRNSFAVSFGGDSFVWSGIDFDVSHGVTGIRAVCPEFDISNLEFHGRSSHSDGHLVQCLSVGVTDRDGEGIVRNVTATKGSTWARYKGGDGRTWMWVGPRHVGTLRVRNCRAEEFGNNAIYGSAAEGPIIVENCAFWNNNVASVRFGADGSAVRNTTIGIDPERYSGPREPYYESHAFHFRGVWVESKVGALNAPGRVRIEDTNIRIRGNSNGALPTGASGIHVRPNACAVDIDGVDIDATAAHAKPVTAATPGATKAHARQDPPHDVDLRRTRVVHGEPVDALVESRGRDLSVRDQCALYATADGVSGVVCEDAAIRAFEDSIVNVPGDTVRPTDTDTSTIDTESTPPEGDWPPGGSDPETGYDPAPEPVADSELFTQFIPMQELIVKTDADDPVEYRLEAAAHCSIEALDSPAGDDVSNDGTVASGKVWPGGADGYALTGALQDASFSGDGRSDAYIEVDGQRVPWYNIVKHTVANAGERLLTKAAETFASLRAED